MSRSNVIVGSRTLTVNFDDPRARGDIFQSIVMGQIMNELTGEPVRTPLKVTTTLPNARTKVSFDGIGGVIGVPRQVFPLLGGGPFPPFDVTFEAHGYLPITETVIFLAQAGYPNAFADKDLGQIQARRAPVAVTGRTVGLSVGNQTVPVDLANVEIVGIWRLVEDVDVVSGSVATPMIAVNPSLYAARPAGAGIEIVALPAVVEPDRLLLRSAALGAQEVHVSNSNAVVLTDVIGFDIGDPDREEFVPIDAITAPNDPNSPAVLRLKFPLKRRHAEGSKAQRTTVPGPGGPDATLTEGASAQDATLFVNSTATLSPAQLVRISGGTAAPEYTSCRLYQATSDSDGYYRLPEIHRVAAFEVTASRALPLPALSGSSPFTPNYALYENRLDLIMS